MFDSGGSSGQLRDELGVLPPGDVLKCALALARNEREARRVLLSRLQLPEQHARLRGHTGGNLLLSMMERYSGDFLAAVDGLRALLGCEGHVWPVSTEQASICAEYGDGSRTRGEVEVDAGQSAGHAITRLWLEPEVRLHEAAAAAIEALDAVDHRAGQLLHEPDADLSRARRRRGDPARDGTDRARHQPADRGPRHVGVHRRRSGAADGRGDRPADRRRDRQHRAPSQATLARYLAEHKRPLARRRRFPTAARSSTGSSGAARSPATIGAGWRRPCGRCWRSSCCSAPSSGAGLLRMSAPVALR